MTIENSKKLTEIQEKTVSYDKGALLVLAGSRAVKTKLLTERIAYILTKTKGEYFKILAFTSTNKAAKEMRERIKNMIGKEIRRTFIDTFHNFCYYTLKAYGRYIELKSDFIIYDNHDDLIRLLSDAVKKRVEQERRGEVKPTILLEKYGNIRVIENVLEYIIPRFYYAYIKLKNKLIDPDKLDESYSKDFKVIFEIYQKTLKEAKVLDFSDLIYYTHKLFKKKKFIANHIKTIYKHILIDEGQDTNKAQFELIKILCEENYKNLFIVADEDQLIFEWNDARFEYLLKLCKKYNMERIQLYESFRCPPDVLEIANLLISHNFRRMSNKKKIISAKENHNNKTSSIDIQKFKTQEDEAKFVIEKIIELTKKKKTYDNICIIGRTKYILNQIIKTLEEKEIPHYVPMFQKKFLSSEMNFIIDSMKIILNKDDRVTFYKICYYLKLDYQKLLDENPEQVLLDIIIDYLNTNNPQFTKILKKFYMNKDEFKAYFDEIKNILQKRKSISDDFKEDIAFFEEIYNDYKQEKQYSSKDLQDFINYIALYSKKEGKGVAVLTGHSSKGLEFDYVFLVSLNQGIFPDYRTIKKRRKLEEERRNCFVAITRTKKKLFISYVEHRTTRAGNLVSIEPSQFLNEMKLIVD